MSDCCANKIKPKKHKLKCPTCEHLCLEVNKETILHHVRQPWTVQLESNHYYYCRSQDCDVVYFSDNNEKLLKVDISTLIGIKEHDENSLICFCFNVNKLNATSSQRAKEFVIEQTKTSNCSCETANPSGRCCLKDFPKNII